MVWENAELMRKKAELERTIEQFLSLACERVVSSQR
jgi:hypothetical protein